MRSPCTTTKTQHNQKKNKLIKNYYKKKMMEKQQIKFYSNFQHKIYANGYQISTAQVKLNGKILIALK